MDIQLLLFFINVSIITGIIGTIVVLKKMASIAGSISHSLLASVALSNILKVSPVITSIPFVFLTSILIHYIKQNKKINEEIALSIIWVIGVSIGIILINLSNIYSSTISFYLFGNILFTDNSDIIISTIFSLTCIIIYIVFNREIKNLILDEEYSKIIGIKTDLFNILILSLIGLAIVFTIKAMGIILLIAIFTIPATIAIKNSNSIEKCILLTSTLSFSSFLSGYFVSFIFNVPVSSTITITLVFIFLLSEIIKRKRGIIWKTKSKEIYNI
ncbi:MAG: metal ABC transporter permease [bacterium]|nr:metal ABC transporter permease [bacterium]